CVTTARSHSVHVPVYQRRHSIRASSTVLRRDKVRAMSHHEIDAYLAGVGEPHRSTLQALLQTIHAIVPQAEEVISYGMPGFRLKGKMICGFAAFKSHVAYMPHSGSVFTQLPAELEPAA